MKRASNNSSSIINQSLWLIRYALCSFVCTCGRLVFYKPKLFLRQVQRDRVKSFPCDFGLASFWQFSSERPVWGGGVKYYSRPFLTPASFSWAVWQLWTWCPITGSQISEIGPLKWISHILPVRRVWCRWQRPSCRSSVGLSLSQMC